MIEDVIRDESPSWVNAKIDRDTLAKLEEFKNASPEQIEERIDELAWEYDLSCATSIACAALGLGGLALSKVHRGFLALPVFANAVLLYQNLPVPSPFTPAFRVFGFRSRTEIERERHALKMMRGDYQRAEEDPTAKGAMTSAQSEGKVPSAPRGKKSRKKMGGSTASIDENDKDVMGSDRDVMGEDLRPMDEPAGSGPSGDLSRH